MLIFARGHKQPVKVGGLPSASAHNIEGLNSLEIVTVEVFMCNQLQKEGRPLLKIWGKKKQ
jgi:hypothetical protein